MAEFDIIVIGAGPAGMSVAASAAHGGLTVFLLDEQPYAGGQIYRNVEQNKFKLNWFGKDYSSGMSFVNAIDHKNITKCFGATVWRVEQNKRVVWSKNGSSKISTAANIVLANGAQERPFPFPGWTLPAVMTVGSAQILMKSAGIFPKESILVGSGPLLYLVATQMIDAKCPPQALLETQTFGMTIKSLIHLPKALLDIKTLVKGLMLIRKIYFSGIPRYKAVSKLMARKNDDKSLNINFLHKGTKKSLNTKLLLTHQGVIPSTHISRSIGITHTWNKQQLAFQPVVDMWGMANIDGIYIAGDCAGINGANSASKIGKRVALKILYNHEKINFLSFLLRSTVNRINLIRTNSIRSFLDTMYFVPEDVLSPTDETIICRCEEKTAGDIRNVLNEGIAGVRQIKTSVRSGMGLCQGRMCDAIVNGILSNEGKVKNTFILEPKARTPIKPITLGEMSKLKTNNT